jgi:preprotein translocase subunit SecD
MERRYVNLILILVILAAAVWIDLPDSKLELGSIQRTFKTVLGLDLRGGMQVLLEADVPADQVVETQSLDDARRILENRSNGLGVSEVVFQVAGNRRIVGEFPGLTKVDEVVAVLKGTGLLEFVDMGEDPSLEGNTLETDYASGGTATSTAAVATSTVNATGTNAIGTATGTKKIWHTVMTGEQLKSVSVTTNNLGKYIIDFTLKDSGTKVFADYTTANVGKYLAIVLDKKIISAPQVQSAITEGRGQISGSFTYESANNLAIQLRYGSLPIPLKVVETKVIGPTLGQDSLNKSIVASVVGFIIVALFMMIFYKLSGAVAVVSILTYALITMALWKLIPVTLTLPGIAGFLLSTGGALDANILMFERLKEELHNGRNLRQAIDLGWKRAWPSIRDSNAATLITSAILFWFGSSYGASIVKGFALTLALGVVVSLFSAYFTTRTFLSLLLEFVDEKKSSWFGA